MLGRDRQTPCCDDQLNPPNTSRSNTPNGLPKLASNRRSAASATAMTTPWPRRSMAFTRPRSSIGVGRGGRSRRSNTPRSNGRSLPIRFRRCAASLEGRRRATGSTIGRLLEPIGNIPPAEAEERYYAINEQRPMALLLKPNSLRQTRRGSLRSMPSSERKQIDLQAAMRRILAKIHPCGRKQL